MPRITNPATDTPASIRNSASAISDAARRRQRDACENRRDQAFAHESGELVLDKLVETLLRTAIEHAGAERGVLIEPRGEALWIRAEGSTSGSAIPIVLRDVPFGGAALPESVVRYAARVHETVNLDDASTHDEFSNDEYIRREHAKSVLCLPLLQQGRLMALLYLENNFAAGVFTPAAWRS